MHPDDLDRMLGPGHNVPWGRICEICEAFNHKAREIAQEAIEKHESRWHERRVGFPEPMIGSELWRSMRRN